MVDKLATLCLFSLWYSFTYRSNFETLSCYVNLNTLSQGIPYLLVYKSTPHFPGQNSDFSAFMVKEIKFRPIEMSQNINLLFLRMYWKHGELKKAEV